MRALPYHFTKIKVEHGACVIVMITGEAGGTWRIINDGHWQFTDEIRNADVSITIHQDHAWKLLTKGLSLEEATAVTQIIGDLHLGKHFLRMLSVMA
jgi:hypothetical protein